MKDSNRQNRLDQLRLREAEGNLSEDEHKELLMILDELDAEEVEALRPSEEKSQHLLQEKAELKETVIQLQTIVTEHMHLLTKAHEYLIQLKTERAAIADKYFRLTGHNLSEEHLKTK